MTHTVAFGIAFFVPKSLEQIPGLNQVNFALPFSYIPNMTVFQSTAVRNTLLRHPPSFPLQVSAGRLFFSNLFVPWCPLQKPNVNCTAPPNQHSSNLPLSGPHLCTSDKSTKVFLTKSLFIFACDVHCCSYVQSEILLRLTHPPYHWNRFYVRCVLCRGPTRLFITTLPRPVTPAGTNPSTVITHTPCPLLLP